MKRRKTRVRANHNGASASGLGLSFVLTYLLVWGMIPVPALAQMAEANGSPIVLDEQQESDDLVKIVDDSVPIELGVQDVSDDPEDFDVVVESDPVSDVEQYIEDLGNGSYKYIDKNADLNRDDTYTFTLNVDNNAIITKYEGTATELIIPESFENHLVVEIGNSGSTGAFAGNTQLTSVKLPNTVVEIGKNAFKGCTGLTGVTLSSGLKRINESAFANCVYIGSVVIPEGTTLVGDSAFANCNSLAQVSLPSTITQIGNSSFSGCVALSQIIIPEAVTSIGNLAFASCTGLVNVSFFTPESTKVPAIKTMGSSVFSGCTGITSIVIPASLVSCGTNKGPFVGCTNLKQVSFEEGATRVANGLLADCPGIESIDVPEGILVVGSSAFKNCGALTQVVLPSTLATIDDSAFLNCTALPQISLPQDLLKIGNSAFKGCTSLPGIDFPSGLTEIGTSAFEASGLSEVLVPVNVTKIGSYAFSGCTSLETVEFASVAEGSEVKTDLGSSAFTGCTALRTVVLSNAITKINASTFQGCEHLENIALPNNLLSIGDRAFRDCDSLRGFVVPQGVKTLGSEVFYDCDGLARIAMPDSVTTLGKSLFYDCDALVEVTFGSGLTAIPDNAFQHCDSLAELVLPRSVTKVGENAFIECTMLASVYTTPSITSIGSSAFSYPKKVTIYGVAGSYAQEYANEHSIKFQSVEVEATSIDLTPPSATLRVGELLQVNVNITPINYTGSITWESSDPLVATVTDAGVVKAVGSGNANISIRVGSKTATLGIAVYQAVTSLSLNKTSLQLEGGQVFKLVPTVKPDNADNKEVAWSSSNESVATVDAKGRVRGLSQGTAVITCSSTDDTNKTATCTVTVTSNAIVATSVGQLQSAHPYQDGTTTSWLYTLTGATSLLVTFDTSTTVEDGADFITILDGDDQAVGTFTGNDLAGRGIDVPGDTVRIRLVTDEQNAMWGFRVTMVTQAGAVSGISLGQNTLSLLTGSTHKLDVTCDPADAVSRVIWKSSNEKVATVSSRGIITAVASGTATITASVGQKSASCDVTVINPISISSASIARVASIYYTGEPITPKPVVTYKGTTLQEGVDYQLEYKNNVQVGQATIVLSGTGIYVGTTETRFTILEKKTNTLSARVKSKTVSCDYDASSSTKLASNVTVSNAVGNVSYENASTDATPSGFVVDSSTGVVTLPKGTLPGSYAIIIRVSATGNGVYKEKSVVVTYTISVAKMTNTVSANAKKATVSCVYNASSITNTVANIAVSGAQGKVAFTNASSDSTAKRFQVNVETGVLSVPKGTKGGTYPVTIKVAAEGNGLYNAGIATATYILVVAQSANPIVAKANAATVSCPYNPNSDKTLSSNISVTGAQGTVSYSNASKNNTAKKFVVNAASGRVTIPKGTKAGTYSVKIKVRAAGNNNYQAKGVTVTYKLTITKIANTLTARASAVTVSSVSLSKAAQYALPIAVSNARGKVTYKKISGSAKLTIGKKSGKVKVKKGTKKGSYSAVIQVSAAGTKCYNPATKTVTVIVNVRDTGGSSGTSGRPIIVL